MMRFAPIALAVLLTAAACAPLRESPVVDGWPVGDPLDCTTSGARCPELLAAATAGLGVRDPGHAPIVQATLHVEGVVFDDKGNQILWTRSGACCNVARFELADGSVRAMGVGYPGSPKTPSPSTTGRSDPMPYGASSDGTSNVSTHGPSIVS